MKRAWELVEISFALLCICVVSALLAHMWPVGEKPKDAWDVLTAIGTVGAAVVATRIALRDATWRRETQESEALIAWGMLAPDVVKVSESLKAAKILLQRPQGLMMPGFRDEGILQLTNQLSFTFGLDLLDKMAYLPNQKGARIAAALGLLPSISSEITTVATGRHSDERRFARRRALTLIEAAIAHFDYALQPV